MGPADIEGLPVRCVRWSEGGEKLAVARVGKIRSIMNSHPGDIIPLGSGGEKKNYQVIKINHQIRSREISDSGEDEAYYEFIVKAISDKE